MANPAQEQHQTDASPLSKKTIPRPASARKEASLAEKQAAHKRAWASQPKILNNHHRVFLGDARAMEGLNASETVHLVVTSPPYWDLKKYEADQDGAQLGHLSDRNTFLESLAQVWRQCYDRLVAGGRMCVVVGDVCRSRRSHGRHLVEPLHAHILLQGQEIGFDPLSPIIWNKIANAVTEVRGNGSGFLGKPYEPNAIIKNDIEYILNFRKPGGYRHPTEEQRALSLISKEDHARWFQPIWTDVPGENQRKHPAPFPFEIARRLIGMYSFVGDTVLDPFWGIGTTTAAAMQMHRSSIGFEIEPKYLVAGSEKLDLLSEYSEIEFNVPEDIRSMLG
ncbi:MAG: site-specific DNA-methyltransferase [Candidatus Hydrogenedentes bacterium]|nr:site-specific DNA-methyltransferase [Candidatus Hydrogenedentota bacterium]